MDFILEYRAYINILLVIIGAIALLFTLRPFLLWYLKFDQMSKELHLINQQLKKAQEQQQKLHQQFSSQIAQLYNQQTILHHVQEPHAPEPHAQRQPKAEFKELNKTAFSSNQTTSGAEKQRKDKVATAKPKASVRMEPTIDLDKI
ncbi:hypothetical protein C2869_11385 [Saccharobesus litoralis]|uniref:Uncharacterized protein n=1 Tax=Saccharobesus litoralis TaxID=2172099 RepID=A0A2S0VS55_9ALTE|nr:hypothetical protein [Saccharobesus litoralis]AWB67002.1 hypothetical protein C2869_11385 [Saccharobesus litoralis]